VTRPRAGAIFARLPVPPRRIQGRREVVSRAVATMARQVDSGAPPPSCVPEPAAMRAMAPRPGPRSRGALRPSWASCLPNPSCRARRGHDDVRVRIRLAPARGDRLGRRRRRRLCAGVDAHGLARGARWLRHGGLGRHGPGAGAGPAELRPALRALAVLPALDAAPGAAAGARSHLPHRVRADDHARQGRRGDPRGVPASPRRRLRQHLRRHVQRASVRPGHTARAVHPGPGPGPAAAPADAGFGRRRPGRAGLAGLAGLAWMGGRAGSSGATRCTRCGRRDAATRRAC
jgi:hypothetical protein